MKQTLYEISEQYLEILNQVEEAEGELTPEMEKALELTQENLIEKAKGYDEFIAVKDAVNMRIDEEVKRLQAMKKRNNSLIDGLKGRLVSAVQLFGEFEVGLKTFGLRKSQAVQVMDEELIPKEFKVTKVTTSVDKKAVKDFINGGGEIEGAELVTNFNLKVK